MMVLDISKLLLASLGWGLSGFAGVFNSDGYKDFGSTSSASDFNLLLNDRHGGFLMPELSFPTPANFKHYGESRY